MALSNELSGAGNEPEQLQATATVGFDPGAGVDRIAHRRQRPRAGHRPGSVRGGGNERRTELPDLGPRLSIEITVDATLEN